MKTLEEIRNECRNENHAARRLLSAGFRLEGWDMNTGGGSSPASRTRTRTTNSARSTSFPTIKPPPLNFSHDPRRIP